MVGSKAANGSFMHIHVPHRTSCAVNELVFGRLKIVKWGERSRSFLGGHREAFFDRGLYMHFLQKFYDMKQLKELT